MRRWPPSWWRVGMEGRRSGYDNPVSNSYRDFNTNLIQDLRANGGRASGGSGGGYSPLVLRMRDGLRGRLSKLMPTLATAKMPPMVTARLAATTANPIQSTPLVCAQHG